MRIKKENKWKVAFSMLEDIYEPIVMFFGLTNSLVTFKTIINDLLRDMTETGDVAALVDNMIVEMEIEEGYDDIMKKVLRKVVENNLFVKLEKYMWKVREIGFLRVVIRLDKMKMEKEKVQGVVD